MGLRPEKCLSTATDLGRREPAVGKNFSSVSMKSLAVHWEVRPRDLSSQSENDVPSLHNARRGALGATTETSNLVCTASKPQTFLRSVHRVCRLCVSLLKIVPFSKLPDPARFGGHILWNSVWVNSSASRRGHWDGHKLAKTSLEPCQKSFGVERRDRIQTHGANRRM